MTMKDPRVVIWIAVSSPEQAEDDKTSLETQERLGREYVERVGGQLVRVFRWDGYSRDNPDPIDALEEFAREKRFEYHDLRDMWKRHAFDILWLCFFDRGGRSFTLSSWVIENVVRNGAECYIHNIGPVTRENYAGVIALGGMQSVTSVQRLVDGRRSAMTRNAQVGLPTSSHIVRSHVVIRDALGEAIGIQVDESKRRLWDDVYDLLVNKKLSYGKLEDALEQLGHLREDGTPYPKHAIHDMMTTPTFWGHGSRYHNKIGANKNKGWSWVYRVDESPPGDVLVFRHTHEPVYKGDQAARVMAALDRNSNTWWGRGSPYRSLRYAGLIICASCGYYMTYHSKTRQDGSKYRYLYCKSRYDREIDCPNRRTLPEKFVDKAVAQLLKRRLAKNVPLEKLMGQPVKVDKSLQRKQIEQEIDRYTKSARILIVKQMQISEAEEEGTLSTLYDEQLEVLGKQIDTLKRELERIGGDVANNYDGEIRIVEDIRSMTLDAFWQQDSTSIQQMLLAMLGKRRFAAYDQEIIKLVPAPKHFRD